MGQWRLPADSFRHHVRDQRRIVAQPLVLPWKQVERDDAAGNGVSRRVVAAYDQQHQIAEKLHAIHVPR